MRITKLELENFKRFTKLTIDMAQLSTPPKLVLLIGANGSGKSSVFDAFNLLSHPILENYDYWGDGYFDKNISVDSPGIKAYFSDDAFISFEDELLSRDVADAKAINEKHKRKFYGRTSFRQVPRLTRLGFKNGFSIERDTDRPLNWIDRDERFENDLEQTYRDLLSVLFDATKERTNVDIVEEFIQPISDAFRRILGESTKTSIRLKSIVPPGDSKTAEVLFTKGESTIHYNLLSAGEKEVFNILLNLSVRGKYYQDTIYFIDEMDLHLEYNTQKAFLKEITENWIPENCQLWTASHSLGFIQYANENEQAAIIDLDNLDFDLEQTIYPSQKNKDEIFEIAVSKEFLADVFRDRTIVFAENTDTAIYNAIGIDRLIFAKAIDKNDVFHKSKNLEQLGLADRDYLTDEELILLKEKYSFLRILNYYSIENYLFHPDNLKEYFTSRGIDFNADGYKDSLIREREKNITDIVYGIQQARSGYPFFKENENHKQYKLFKEQGSGIVEMLKSEDFETFYKVFPAKDYGKAINERQNLNSRDLAKTKWFKQQIEKVLQK
jgi:predicted ATP-binding protein involved in virulence